VAFITIQDLGSLGELIAAIATVATLIYLAVQLRQNTRAQRSSTFQEISAQMGQNIETLITNRELTEVMAKVLGGSTELTPVERIRFQGVLVMSFRRLEAVFVQTQLDSIDEEMAGGFERSLLPLIVTPLGIQWWKSAKNTFHRSFVSHVDNRIADGEVADQMPSIVLAEEESVID
jgi:hypothetical protein